MTQEDIEKFVGELEDVEREENMGYIFFFVGDNHTVPFVSIAQSDNEHDSASQLHRGGIYRLNIGVSKKTYESLFTNTHTETIEYSTLDVFLPHPHYSKQFFICILNPEKHSEEAKTYIKEAYSIAKTLRGAKEE
jgi:hypothetical protein